MNRPSLLSGTHERGCLPHWKAEGSTYFVTFRLAGTLPAHILDAYRAERAEILERAEQMNRPLTPDEHRRLRELHSERIERYLDAGHGECWLARPEIAQRVADAVRFFAGRRYDLHAWVIMPNHGHGVLTPLGKHTLSAILHTWKSYTANEANRILGRAGQPFWESESYDHIIRDEEEFARLCRYTIDNPVMAGLCRRPEDWAYSSAHEASAAGRK